MKNFKLNRIVFISIVVLSFSLVFVLKALALDVEVLQGRAAKATKEFVVKKMPRYKNSEIKVVFKYSDSVFDRLSKSGNDVNFVVLDEYSGYKPVGNVFLPVKVKAKGAADEKIYLRAKVSIIEKVVASSRIVRKKEIITADDLQIIEKDVSLYPYTYFSDKGPIIGMQSNSTISKGAIIAEWMVKTPPVIERNDRISIYVNVGDIAAEAEGIAMEDGSIGDEIKVRNASSKKELKAVVVDEGVVEVMVF